MEAHGKSEPAKYDATLTGIGALKERVESRVPSLNVPIIDALEIHRDTMSKYAGLAVPVRNFNSLMNWGGPDPADSMKSVLGHKWGQSAVKYVDDLLVDCKTAQLIGKYTPLLDYRSKGYSTQELGDLAKRRSWLQKNKVTKFLFGGAIQAMDVQTVKRIWIAAEYRVSHDTDLAPATEDFYRATADVFNRAVSRTQPMYSEMDRPNIMKRSSATTKAFSMMKTVPLQYQGMLRESWRE